MGFRRASSRRWILLLLGMWFLAVFLLTGSDHRLTAEEDLNRAGVVIQYGDGRVETYCVLFSEPEISGLDLLQRTGVDVIIDTTMVWGAAVCKIGAEGCNFPLEPCFCQCQGATCVYWAYYHLRDGTWVYSDVGPSNYVVRDGDVDGWAWGAGLPGVATPPPVVELEAICPLTTSPVTVTPTPTPTATATPLPSPTPTFTPIPASPLASPTPMPPTPALTPLAYTFSVARDTLRPGECTLLFWSVQGVERVELMGPWGTERVSLTGERRVCPAASETYTLVLWQGETSWQVPLTVRVAPPTPPPLSPTATSTPTPVPTPTPSPWRPQGTGPLPTTPTRPVSPATPQEPSQVPVPRPTMTEAPSVSPVAGIVVTPRRPGPTPWPSPSPTSTPTPEVRGTSAEPGQAIVRFGVIMGGVALSAWVIWRRRRREPT